MSPYAQVHSRSEASRRAPALRPGFALRQALARGYGRADLRADLMHMPEHFAERVVALVRALPTVHWPDVAVGALTLAVLYFWPRVTHSARPARP